jgi:hypothetical protein
MAKRYPDYIMYRNVDTCFMEGEEEAIQIDIAADL